MATLPIPPAAPAVNPVHNTMRLPMFLGRLLGLRGIAHVRMHITRTVSLAVVIGVLIATFLLGVALDSRFPTTFNNFGPGRWIMVFSWFTMTFVFVAFWLHIVTVGVVAAIGAPVADEVFNAVLQILPFDQERVTLNWDSTRNSKFAQSLMSAFVAFLMCLGLVCFSLIRGTLAFLFVGFGVLLALAAYAFESQGVWRKRLEFGSMALLAMADLSIMLWSLGAATGSSLAPQITDAWQSFLTLPWVGKGVAVLAVGYVIHTLTAIGKPEFNTRIKELAWAVILLIVATNLYSCGSAGINQLNNALQTANGTATSAPTTGGGIFNTTGQGTTSQTPAGFACKSPALNIASDGTFSFAPMCPEPALGGTVAAGETITITRDPSTRIKPRPSWSVSPDVWGVSEPQYKWADVLRYPKFNPFSTLVVLEGKAEPLPFGQNGSVTIKGPATWSLYYNIQTNLEQAWKEPTGSIKFHVKKNP